MNITTNAFLTALIFFLLSTSNSLKAQERVYDQKREMLAPDKKNIIKWNPLSIGFGTVNLAYERVINEKITAQFGIAFLNTEFNAIFGDSRSLAYKGQVYTLEGRYYLIQNDFFRSPKGLFVAPFIRFNNISEFRYATPPTSGVPGREMDGSLTSFGIGGMLGYQLIVAKRISFDAFVGPYYSFSNFDLGPASDPSLEEEYNILFDEGDIRAGATVGFRF
jgi:hypothetical protein